MDEPVRILHVFGRLDRGGAETMLMNLYRNIDRNKVQFDFVICTTDLCDYTNEIKSMGGRVYSIPRFNFKNSLHYIRAWHALLREHPEYKIIHGHLRSTAAIYLRIAKKYGCITISHSHSTSSGYGFSALTKTALQYPIRFIADYFFTCSNQAGIWLYGEKACKKKNYILLKNAIDVKEYSYNEEKRQETREKLNLEGKFVIGHIGTFKSAKNHKFIIDVFQEIHRKCDSAVLLLVGDGDLRLQIENQVNDAGIADYVIFTGVSSKIPSLLQAMDVFLFPSFYEGLPVSVIEAQAAGLKCFLSDTISNESSVTPLVEYVSLTNTAEAWSDEILQYSNGYIRRNMYHEIKDAGYDIEASCTWIEKFYLENANK